MKYYAIVCKVMPSVNLESRAEPISWQKKNHHISSYLRPCSAVVVVAHVQLILGEENMQI